MARSGKLRWRNRLKCDGEIGCFYSSANNWSWIESIRFAEGADNEALAYYVDAVRRAAEDKARLEGLVEAEARKPRWRKRVDSLRCC